MELRSGTNLEAAPPIPPRTPQISARVSNSVNPSNLETSPPPIPPRTPQTPSRNFVSMAPEGKQTSTSKALLPPTSQTPNYPQRVDLPNFAESNIGSWIQHVDILIHQKTEQEKRTAILQALPSYLITELGISKEDKYNVILEKLKQGFNLSKEKKLIQLLRETSMGDRKPSAYLNYLKTLSEDKEIVKFKFKEVLPENFLSTMIILERQNLSLENIVSVLDELTLKENSSISSLKMKPESKKEKNVETLFPNDVCWYHFNFGRNAKKCVSGCSYKSLSHQYQGNASPH